MEYKKDTRTKHLTLRDIHVGDWVQVWSEATERYSLPLKITSICDDGTIYLVTSDEGWLTPWEEDIKNVDALPITDDLLKGFGFEVSGMSDDRGTPYQEIEYKGKYVGALYYYREDKAYLYTCGYKCLYMHELIAYNHRNHIEMNLEWKGVKNGN